MPYVIEKAEDKLADALSDPAGWVKRDKVYATMFDAIADARNQHVEKGTTLKTPEWKCIARMPSTLEDALRFLKDGGFIKDKKGFYEWLDRNPQYCTYDRVRGRRK